MILLTLKRLPLVKCQSLQDDRGLAMNMHATEFLFQARLTISIVRWITQRLVLQLTPIIATYLERGGVAALSMAAMWVAQSIRNRTVSNALSGSGHRSTRSGLAGTSAPAAREPLDCTQPGPHCPQRLWPTGRSPLAPDTIFTSQTPSVCQ
jgi:hypothetical protein